jgi:peptidoglycan/LPS O-acetylase OafA/YrhL
MSRTFSTYLDAVRFVAALMVLLEHAAQPHTGALPLGPLGHFGHDAVVVFFVLSGLVICHAVHHRDRSLQIYVVNRAARLWSVVVPALLLTVVLGALGGAMAPARYAGYGPGVPIATLLGNLFFVNQLWFLDLSPPSNSPFWSLGFEVWYYIFFGCIFFLRGRPRIVAGGLAIAAMGPKILILLPVWLLGAGLYRIRPPAHGRLGAALFFGAAAVYLLFRWSALSQPLSLAVLHRLPALPLGMAKYFVNDYLVALLVAANFIGFRLVEERWARTFAAIEKPIRFLAGYTFSLYLFHYPLLLFVCSFLPNGSYLSLPAVLAITAALGSLTERRRDVLRKALWRLLAADRAGPPAHDPRRRAMPKRPGAGPGRLGSGGILSRLQSRRVPISCISIMNRLMKSR